MAERTGRRTFGPVVLIGLVGAGLAAMAGHEAWVTGRECPSSPGVAFAAVDSPATTAVALALLAAWGVLLVTRGKVRLGAAVLAVVLAAGLVATVLLGIGTAEDNIRSGIQGAGPFDCVDTHKTGWFWVAVAALVPAGLAALAALRFVSTWPEMGRKYDAPAEASPAPEKAPEEQENLDLWKAMDEGRDPTA